MKKYFSIYFLPLILFNTLACDNGDVPKRVSFFSSSLEREIQNQKGQISLRSQKAYFLYGCFYLAMWYDQNQISNVDIQNLIEKAWAKYKSTFYGNGEIDGKDLEATKKKYFSLGCIYLNKNVSDGKIDNYKKYFDLAWDQYQKDLSKQNK